MEVRVSVATGPAQAEPAPGLISFSAVEDSLDLEPLFLYKLYVPSDCSLAYI